MGEPIPFPTAAKPSASVMSVDPATAERWLGHNTRNRSIRRRVVTGYASDMAAGHWQLTGEAIKFAADGTLLDGQHRLMAVIDSGATVQMFVVRGLLPPSQDVMDTGAKRGAKDMLEMYGVGNSVLAASAAKWAILYDENRLYIDRTTQTVTHSDVLEFVSDNEVYADAVAFTSSIKRHIDLQPSILGATAYITHQVSPEGSREFFARLADGIGLPAGSPILALRSRLREIKAKRTRVEPEAFMSVVLRAWNAWRADRSMASIPVYKGKSSIRCPRAK